LRSACPIVQQLLSNHLGAPRCHFSQLGGSIGSTGSTPSQPITYPRFGLPSMMRCVIGYQWRADLIYDAEGIGQLIPTCEIPPDPPIQRVKLLIAMSNIPSSAAALNNRKRMQ
jgi:hypothetical protein